MCKNTIKKQFKYINQNKKQFIVSLLLGKDFWNAYIYFRWIDDYIDDPNIIISTKKDFLKKQKQKLKKIIQKKKITLNYEESCIRKYLINNCDKESIKYVLNMIDFFEYDLNRINKHIKEKEFIKYSKILSDAYTFICIRSLKKEKVIKKYNNDCKNKNKISLFNLLSSLAHFSHIAHIKRDYQKDLKLGFYNYPKNKKPDEFFDYLIKKNKNLYKKYFKYINQTLDLRLKIILFYYNKKFSKYYN